MDEAQPTSSQKKSLMSWDKKEMMYAFIVIFLLLTMYYVGQISTQTMEAKVNAICAPQGYAIGAISPFDITLIRNQTHSNLSIPVT